MVSSSPARLWQSSGTARRLWQPVKSLLHPVHEAVDPSFVLGIPYRPSKRVVQLVKTVSPYTMCDPLRLSTLYGLVREVCAAGVEGAIVEAGCRNGGTSAVLGAALLDSGETEADRELWLYDSFEGLPQASVVDGPVAQEMTGQLKADVKYVQAALNSVEFPLTRAVVRKGFFKETFKEALPHSVALVNADGDWYESVLDTLRAFYPLVPDGGVIVLDDFGAWEGAREAFYDFCQEQHIRPLLERIGMTQAFWRKGETHNRDTETKYYTGVYRPEVR